MIRTRRIAAALAALVAAPAIGAAQDTRPVVAVLYFDNNSIGKDRADYDGLGKGIADLLITDLAASPRMRVVERERVQKLLEEQNLVRTGAVDPATAVKVGKLLGARYLVTGAFMADGRGTMVLTARAINLETGQITNPSRVQEKTDDVLALVATMSKRLDEELKLPAVTPVRTGDASQASDSAVVGQQAAAHHPASQAAVSHDSAKAAHHEGMKAAHHDTTKATQHAQQGAAGRQAAAHEATHVAQQSSGRPTKLDVRTAILYSKALEEQDQGRTERAAELYRAVLDRFPEFEPAKRNYEKVSRSKAG